MITYPSDYRGKGNGAISHAGCPSYLFVTLFQDISMNTITTIRCPHCGKEVRLIRFGNGYTAICCEKIIYNSYKLPGNEKKEDNTSENNKGSRH